MIEAFFFIFLLFFTLINPRTRLYLEKKSCQSWVLDSINLFIQGFIIPFLGAIFVSTLYVSLIPSLQNSLQLPALLTFFLNIIFVDYLYYLNHRFFHLKKVFPIHITHHTVSNMDVVASSRNTFWTSFLIIYLWINSFFIYILHDPSWYIIGMALSVCLDMWKHSMFLVKHPLLNKILSKYLFIMTPTNHAWHHAQKIQKNFGANFNLFDRLHQTYYDNSQYPKKLGIKNNLSFFRKCFFPF